ncbi:MAG TPA: hypothetical protein VF609_08895 [Flavisolibacter sp.]|jgi:hypothetical protein
MKLHLAAIAFNEKELEAYIIQLKTQRFEAVSEVKKAEDGTFYQVMARTVKENTPSSAKAIIPAEEAVAG